ncbi:hypothetical protein CF335_g8028, partial [Tilletia laevis]
MATGASAAVTADSGGGETRATERAKVADLEQARSELMDMLTLLDRGTAASLPLLGPPLPHPALAPAGLCQALGPLLAPVLQPLHQLQQRAAAAAQQQQQQHQPATELNNAFRMALQNARELAKAVGGAGGSADPFTEDNKTKRKNARGTEQDPSPAIQLALDLMQKANTTASPSAAAGDKDTDTDATEVLNPVLLLRKRKRAAEDAQRAARRRRTADTVRLIESASLSSSSSASVSVSASAPAFSSAPGLDGVVAKKQRRHLCFRPPTVRLHDVDGSGAARSSDADGDVLLRSKALEAYLARVQVHPMWKVPRLASQNASNALGQALGAGAHKEDHHSTAPPPPSSSKITLSVYASALSASASRWSSLLYAGEERDTTLDSSSSPSSSAAILVQIEGVLQALLTLGLRRDTQRGNDGPPVVVVVHANIRSALEMEPLVDGVTKGGAGAGHSSLVGSAHLSSASTLHRSLSSDLMAFLAHERARPSSNQKKEAEGEGEGDEAEPTWREVGTALMYIRGLRTLEDISVPALPPSHGALQGEEAGAGNARQGSDPSSSASTSPTAVLGFVHFLDA